MYSPKAQSRSEEMFQPLQYWLPKNWHPTHLTGNGAMNTTVHDHPSPPNTVLYQEASTMDTWVQRDPGSRETDFYLANRSQL
ncbi:MAG: hypothetical protein EHM80_07140 [Nitrospiraceae bacterium]|nr:MAG: hypothetical protein EHM80_07140 [Nitrospiraceae bacterium]